MGIKINYYKDPYLKTRIQWKVRDPVFFSFRSGNSMTLVRRHPQTACRRLQKAAGSAKASRVTSVTVPTVQTLRGFLRAIWLECPMPGKGGYFDNHLSKKMVRFLGKASNVIIQLSVQTSNLTNVRIMVFGSLRLIIN